MVAVTCGLADRTIRVRSYVEGGVSPDDMARIRRISSQVGNEFLGDGLAAAGECAAGEYGRLEMLDFWAFYRHRD